MDTDLEVNTARRPASVRMQRLGHLVWVALRFLVALFFFVGALQIMKTGAAGLDMLQPGGALVRNQITTLGLGWLGALFVLSGSPVAATALTLVKAGEEAAADTVVRFTEVAEQSVEA